MIPTYILRESMRQSYVRYLIEPRAKIRRYHAYFSRKNRARHNVSLKFADITPNNRRKTERAILFLHRAKNKAVQIAQVHRN